MFYTRKQVGMSVSQVYGKNRQLMKVVLLGDCGVGKTSLINRYVNNKFAQSYKATVGVDFVSKDIMLKDRIITIQIWDTAGQERFKCLSSAFFRGSDVIVLTFDLTRRSTFESLDSWLDLFYESCSLRVRNTPLVLLGNKCDEKNFDVDRVKDWASSHGAIYFEVSAKNDFGVREAFAQVAEFGPMDKEPESATVSMELIPQIVQLKEPHTSCCEK